MRAPLAAHLGYWSPGARLLPSSIRAWYNDEPPSEGDIWNDHRGAGPNLGLGAGSVGSVTRNGRMAASFDGTDWLTAAFANAQPFTILLALKCSTWVTTRAITDGVGTTVRVQRSGASLIRIYAGTNLDATFSSTLTDRWVAGAAVFNGADSRVY